MASFRSNVRAALASLREQRQRAVLSALGITVGSMAIVLLVSIGRGVQKDLGGQIEDLGVNLLVVLPFRPVDGNFFMPNAAGLSYLRAEDVERVRRVRGVQRATPFTFVGGSIRNGDATSPSTLVLATGPEWFRIRPTKLMDGRVYEAPDADKAVCVLGALAARALFSQGSAVGQTVSINAVPYRVIGVAEEPKGEGSLFSAGSFANVAYIPHDLFRRSTENAQIHRIMIQSRGDVEPKGLVQGVEKALGERLEPEMYSVQTQEDLLGLVFKILGILTWLLTGLTSIALVVGGVGIMTVMLMSVSERAKEIGIRKTVGARRSDIFTQFLVEALCLAGVGGLAGLTLSYAACLALYYGTPVKPLIEWQTVVLGLGVSTAVGGFFGLVPAMRAARQNPVDALRHE